jgi:DNA-binding MarR family transcriptional regulator
MGLLSTSWQQEVQMASDESRTRYQSRGGHMDQNSGSTDENAPTNNATVDALMHLVEDVVAVHIRLQVLTEELHDHSELSRACRGILRDLHQIGPRTVPQLARGRPVSRPNVLMLVNRLIAHGLAETLPNPDHKRSYLVRLTPRGASLFEEMERRERDALSQLKLDDLTLSEIQAASRTLQRLHAHLAR